ncbi:MAG: hypothetical protein US76_00170 [Parcubacteria group bacterium GW2011_GWA2_38_13b]|nr:MAG: hypothetical protein US76_00170 [Parcubacteria group bacterium GW2011_GWA2_38_13b]
MILKSLLKFLEDKKIKYEIIKHKTVYTAIDAAGTQHVKPDEIIKTLVMNLDNKYALALISASKNLDKDKFKKAANVWAKKNNAKVVKIIGFAKEIWMKKNLKGGVGATPPFGELIEMPTLVDAFLLKQKNLFINTGDYEYSVKLSRAGFEKAIGKEMFKGTFSKKK